MRGLELIAHMQRNPGVKYTRGGYFKAWRVTLFFDCGHARLWLPEAQAFGDADLGALTLDDWEVVRP